MAISTPPPVRPSSIGQGDMDMYILLQGSPWGCGWLEVPGMSQVERGNIIRRFYAYDRCEVRLCCTAAVAVVPLLYCADACEIQRKCVGWNLFLVDMSRMARPHDTPTRTHGSTVRT